VPHPKQKIPSVSPVAFGGPKLPPVFCHLNIDAFAHRYTRFGKWLDLALSQINLGADTETNIRNNLNAGKVVTTHTTKTNFNGWIGEGYISIDPVTGSGAYQIAGEGNRSVIVATALGSILLGFLFAALFATGVGALLVAGALSMFAMYSYTNVVTDLLDGHESGKLSDQEFTGTIKLLSILTIVSSFLGVRGLLKKDDGAEILYPLYIHMWALWRR
jgi:hypothetical protein